MREYYALFSCDEWKSYSSFSLIGVFSKAELVKVLRKRIKSKEMEFDREVKELKEMEVRAIDSSLTYGFIQPLHLNEEL